MENQTANSTFISPSVPPPPIIGGTKNSKKRTPLFFKLILAVLGVAVLIMSVRLFSTVIKPVPKENIAQVQPLTGGEFSVLSDKPQYNVGDPILITTKIFTGGYTSFGADLIIKYDPAKLDIAGDNAVTVGNAFPDYPLAKVDTKAGLISISGITPPSKAGFTGITDFATIQMRAKSAGLANLVVDFKLGATEDSNIIRSGSSEDILKSAQNAVITIK